jgi:hypothetical protein
MTGLCSMRSGRHVVTWSRGHVVTWSHGPDLPSHTLQQRQARLVRDHHGAAVQNGPVPAAARYCGDSMARALPPRGNVVHDMPCSALPCHAAMSRYHVTLPGHVLHVVHGMPHHSSDVCGDDEQR